MSEVYLPEARPALWRVCLRRSCIAVVAGFVLSNAGNALSAPPLLSPSVTPGGVQPDLQRRMVPKAPDTGGFPIPPVIDRPLGIDDGQSIPVNSFVLEGI